MHAAADARGRWQKQAESSASPASPYAPAREERLQPPVRAAGADVRDLLDTPEAIRPENLRRFLALCVRNALDPVALLLVRRSAGG
jgi:hypothetical protein